MDLMAIRRRLLMMAAAVRRVLHTITSATGLVSFSTNLAEPLESCVCEFAPVQSGTGDPSPTNVRPITGWTGLTVGHAEFSRKLIPTSSDKHWENNGISVDYVATGAYWIHGTSTAAASISIPVESFTIPSSANRIFEMHNSAASTSVSLVLLTASSGSIDSWVANPANRVSTGYSAMKGKTVGITRFTVQASKTVDLIIAPTFAESKQTDIPVNWTSAAGTVYGGTLDVVSGVLTVSFANFDAYEHRSKFTQGNGNVYILGANFNPLGFAYPINTSKAHSSHLKALSASSSSTPSFAIGNTGIFAVNGAAGITDTPAHWTAYLEEQITAGTPVQFILPLRTPQSYQLTPSQISSLIGNNTVWHDGNGSISVGYYDKS